MLSTSFSGLSVSCAIPLNFFVCVFFILSVFFFCRVTFFAISTPFIYWWSMLNISCFSKDLDKTSKHSKRYMHTHIGIYRNCCWSCCVAFNLVFSSSNDNLYRSSSPIDTRRDFISLVHLIILFFVFVFVLFADDFQQCRSTHIYMYIIPYRYNIKSKIYFVDFSFSISLCRYILLFKTQFEFGISFFLCYRKIVSAFFVTILCFYSSLGMRFTQC